MEERFLAINFVKEANGTDYSVRAQLRGVKWGVEVWEMGADMNIIAESRGVLISENA